MIQRIQTIFLALAAVSGFSVLGLPFATTPAAVQASSLFADQQYSSGDNIGLLVLFVVGAALALASIFLFKNRTLQMKISRFSLIAFVLAVVLAVVLFWQDQANLGGAVPADGLAAYMPLLSIVSAVLALRFIKKDEEKVKSMDRLR